MVIALIGESCTGKSTLAGMLKEKLGALVFQGKTIFALQKARGTPGRHFARSLQRI